MCQSHLAFVNDISVDYVVLFKHYQYYFTSL